MPEIRVTKDSPNVRDGFYAKDAKLDELPENMNDLSLLCLDSLAQAAEANAPTLIMPAIPYAEPTSRMVQAISIVYRTLRSAGAKAENPKEVLIYCEDERVFKTYMVVWNLYYAGTKAERMNDGRWD